jgi:intein/homing endonuclease
LDHDGDARFTKVLIAIKITGEDEKSKEKALANFPLQVRLSGLSLLSTQTQEKLMASFTRASLPVLRGYSVLPIDLADFPRLDRSNISKGRCGDIHWYKVPEDVRVLALNRETGQPEWAEVSRWTVHHGCEVELVTLANGACIFTDDDPRGVLGVVPGESLKVVTATPTDAQAKGMLVPRAVYYGGVEETAEVMEIPQFYNSDVDKSRTHKLATEIELDAEFGWLIGAHVADGWSQFDAERSTGVCFAKSHAPTRDKWQQQVSRFLIRVPHFGSRARTKEDAQKSGEAFGGTVASVLSAGCLGRLFVDMFGHGAGNKYLPDFATCGPRPFRAAIICGLLDTDATVAYNQSKAKKNPQLQVWYNTTSLRLARDIVLVAASVGVQAKVRFSKVTDAGNAAWEVSFRSGDIQDLVTEFPDVMVNDERRLLILNAIIDRESSSYQRLSRVPITYELAASLRKKLGMPKDRSRVDADHSTLYSALQSAAKSGYMSQAAARLTSTRIGDDYIRSLPDGELFIQYRDNDAVTWEYIESVEKTGKVETGYDLTVLGYENWMDTSGVFGPNTMNFHAVITPEAAEEVKKKMFPSKNLFAASDFKTPMAVPRQDHALGLWLASTAKSKDAKPVAFRTIADATKAFARNEINIDTPVTILEQ